MPVTNFVYGANAASSTMGSIAKQIRVDPASGKVYTLGTSISTFLEFSVDGSSATAITYSTNLPAISNIDFVVSNGQMFLSPTNGNLGLYRYDLSGATANFVASSTWTSGVTSIAFGPAGTIYANKGTALFPHDFSLNRTAATTTLTVAPIHMAYAGSKVYYINSVGRIDSNDLLGNDVLILNAGASITKALSVSSDATAIYIASSTAIRKISASNGSPYWSKTVNLVSMDLNTSTGKIYTVDGGGVVTMFDPINAVSAFSATSTGSDVTLNIANSVDTDFSGVMIRRSAVSYPTSATDGTGVTSTANSTVVDSGLSNGTYYYTAFNKTIDGYYGQGVTTSVTVAVPPDPPVISANVNGSNVSLSWTSPASAVSYLLKRSTFTYPLTTSDGSAVTTTGFTSLVDAGMLDGTIYYSVFARDAQGNYSSAGTTTASVDTTGPNVPDAFSASASGSSVNLSWSNPGNMDFLYESIRHDRTNPPATPSDGTAVATTTATSYADTDLSNGTYYYSIFAYDGSGNYSNAATTSVVVNNTPPVVYSSSGGGAASVLPTSLASGGTPLSFSVGSVSQSGALSLIFNADPRTVKGYAVSFDATFKDANIIPFTADTKNGTVQVPNKKGTYKIYLKYYSLTGETSDTFTQIVTVAGANTSDAAAATVPATINRVLTNGSVGNDVKALQQFLNAHGFTLSASGAGSPGKETTVFGPATTKALIKFQEAYADKILKPLGLKKGTGVLGGATMRVIESL